MGCSTKWLSRARGVGDRGLAYVHAGSICSVREGVAASHETRAAVSAAGGRWGSYSAHG
jgi:hypothetical protein